MTAPPRGHRWGTCDHCGLSLCPATSRPLVRVLAAQLPSRDDRPNPTKGTRMTSSIPAPSGDDPCLRVNVETRFGETGEANQLIDPTGWAAISQLVTADEWTGGPLGESIPVLADDWLATWVEWHELAADPVLAGQALKTALAAAVAAGQEVRAQMRVAPALLHLLKNGAPE